MPGADLLEADAARAGPVDLAVVLVVPAAVVRLWRVAEVPVVQVHLADAARAVPAAVAARTPLSIPRMAKFPTRWRLARSPTS